MYNLLLIYYLKTKNKYQFALLWQHLLNIVKLSILNIDCRSTKLES